MVSNGCPCCEGELVWKEKNQSGQDSYQCHACQLIFHQLAFCPDCQYEVAKIQACGAVSYFCSKCNELKSKSRITFKYQRADI